MKTKILNELKMILFVMILGVTAGVLIRLFLTAVKLTTSFLWETLADKVQVSWYPLVLCGAGGLVLGILHKLLGDYPNELAEVIQQIKKDKYYDYKPLASILICAFVPLILGSSVGPEAGLTGIIAALCYWVADNIKFAKENKEEYNEIGAAITLGLVFHSPLFGILSVSEEKNDASDIVLPKLSKVVYYCLALLTATLTFWALGKLFGQSVEGIKGFSEFTAGWLDYVLLILYIPAGIFMCMFYGSCAKILGSVSSKTPGILREILGGLVIGLVAMSLPMLLFSGEEQIDYVAENFGSYAPMFLIAIALLKVVFTSLCIKFGFKGGHFFPLIFATVSMGIGLAMLFFAKDVAGHAAFAAGIVTAAALGAQLKKPLAVGTLLLLIFPVKMVFYIFLVAALSAWLPGLMEKRKAEEKNNK